jgi:hypothetical protein
VVSPPPVPAIEWRCKRKNGTFHHSVTAQQKIACKVDSVMKDLELVHIKLENSDYVVGVGFAEMRQLGLDPLRLQQHYQLHAVVQEVDHTNASLLFRFHAIA